MTDATASSSSSTPSAGEATARKKEKARDKDKDEDKDTRGTLAQPELFNLADDPHEQHNLAATQPEKFKELSALLEKYRAQGYSRPGWKSP